MSPFFALFAAMAAVLVLRAVVGYYREREVFARYHARVSLAAPPSTDEDASERPPATATAEG